MTDTAPTPTKRTQRPRDVDYTLEIVDDLPERASANRTRPLEDQLAKIKENEKAVGKWVRIGNYTVGSAATAAANVLRQRHGDKPAVEGWDFRTVRTDTNEDEPPRTGLYARFDPGRIVAGEAEAFAQREKDRVAKNDERKALKNGQDTPNAQNAPEKAKPAGRSNRLQGGSCLTQRSFPSPQMAGSSTEQVR